MAKKKEQVDFDGSKKKGKDAGKGEDGEKEKSEAKEEDAKEGNEILKKGSRKGNKNEAKVVLPLWSSDRPIRERKTVERFMMGDIPRASPSNTLSIEKGKGMKLKDIPNVAFKLSKTKPDETLQLLHNVLFGQKSKAHTLKKNIGLFSGFVWAENEEKQRTKVKEKFEKCVKEKLLAFCDILNIPVTKSTTKKELITKLLDFLESPHAATDSLPADMEKGKKPKSTESTSKSPTSSDATAGKSKQKQKLSSQSGKKSKPSIEEEEEEEEEEDNDGEGKSSQIDNDHDDDSAVGDGESEEEHHSKEATDDDDDDSTVGEGESEDEHHSEEGTDDGDSTVGEGESEEEHHSEEATDDGDDDDSTAGEGETEDEHHSEEGTDADEDEPGKHMDVEQSSSKKSGKTDSGKSEMKCNKSVGKGSNVTASKTGKSTQKGKVTTRSSKKKKEEDNGKGMQLKDIPNVAFKLSKTKPDETLQLLHDVLFGKKSKVHTLKKNIGLFSGFVWAKNEQRTKVKKKFEKCVKEKLLAFCDILNIPVTKSTTKKELITKLLDFLESPHATTDSLLAGMEKGKKRKTTESTSKSPTSDATAGKSKQKQKLSSQSGKKSKPSIEEEDDDDDSTVGEGKSEDEHHSEEATDDDDGDSTDGEGESEDEHHSEEGTDDDEDEPAKHMDVEKSSSKKSGKKDNGKTELKSNKSVGKGSNVTASKTGKSTKNPSGSTSKKESDAESRGKVMTRSSKKKKEEDNDVPTKGASASKKKSSKSSKNRTSVSNIAGKGEGSIAAKKQPSREEMHAAATNILNEVDFDVVKVADVFRQLAMHFGVDLVHRIEEVKEIIVEVMESILKNMSDDSGDEARKDGDDK